ncbi:glycosyltransferase [Azorhizobium caulinodans]|nr:glycosyltransferase [Azorhizobium caulinodans]
MSATHPVAIYVDARALQDPDYRFRGIGQHASSLLEALRRRSWNGPRPRLIAVVDVAREPLHDQHRRIFDEVTSRTSPSNMGSRKGAVWYITLSPMTHDPVWARHFLEDTSIYRICLFYDLIQLQYPERYLANAKARTEFLICLSWLSRYDAFAAISQFTADELIARVKVPAGKVFVSHVAVRQSLEPEVNEAPLPRSERRWIVVAGGGDPRKNVECAIRAHARSAKLAEAGIKLVIFGNYPETMRAEFRSIYAEEGGTFKDLQFLAHQTDSELHNIYRQGLATVVPSRAEGFSIPIIESSAAGTPALASDVGAHPELIRDAAWRFDPDDPEKLQAQLEKLALDPVAWTELQTEQRDLWQGYRERIIGQRFIDGILERQPAQLPSAAVLRKAKPKIAILTPLPPAHSGVADYSAYTLRPLKAVADLHMFTQTPGAFWEEGWAGLGRVSDLKFRSDRFDAVISIAGNSDHHSEIIDYLLENGGACIAHDARQLDFYMHVKGAQKTVELASAEMGRPVSLSEVTTWLQNQRNLPVLFLSEIVRAANPTIVHSPKTADIIEQLYGTKVKVLPFAQYRDLPADILETSCRESARRKLGIPSDEVVLTTFGAAGATKGLEALIPTLGMLHRWGVKARLVFCGEAQMGFFQHIIDAATRIDIEPYLTYFDKPVSEETYVDYLAASDIGIQLREYFMGGLSGALNDCIAAGLPSVANTHLAEAMNAPGYVRRVPDGLSPVLIAEAVMELLEQGIHLRRPAEQARAAHAERQPKEYCRQLLAALGIDAGALSANR